MKPSSAAEFVDHLVDFFDASACRYDDWAGGLHRRVAARLVELAAPAAGEQVLDVGTGTGLVARAAGDLVGAEGSVLGIDLSEGMLRIAREGAPANTRFVGMAAEHLVFREGTFDLVTYGESLSYLVDPFASLVEAHRVLRPGGRVALSCHRRSLATAAQECFFAVLRDLTTRHPLRVPRHSDERSRLGEPEELGDLLRDAGFGPMRFAQMVTGHRLRDARAWIALMEEAGPFTHALISTMGPVMRARLEEELTDSMTPLGEERFHCHFPFTFVVAER